MSDARSMNLSLKLVRNAALWVGYMAVLFGQDVIWMGRWNAQIDGLMVWLDRADIVILNSFDYDRLEAYAHADAGTARDLGRPAPPCR